MIRTTLCYLRYEGKTLMLFRNKKAADINEGKWIGAGGKFEKGETAGESDASSAVSEEELPEEANNGQIPG